MQTAAGGELTATGGELTAAAPDHPHHPDLEKWRANVGETVTLDLAPPLPVSPAEIDVLCWNVAIGKGRLVERIRALTAMRARIAASRPLVVLVQEAFREDATIPDIHTSEHHGGHAPVATREGGTREDIVDVARELGFSLRYAPSMRNGWHRSDRGNAVLSSVALDATHWVTLPYVRQRRASIAVRLAGLTGGLWLTTAHLDTHGRHRPHPLHGIRATYRGFGAGRAAQAAALADATADVAGAHANVIIGADLNSYLGLRDPAVRTLVELGFRHSERVGKWRHTFHGPLRLMLDHVMYRTAGYIENIHVRRVDQGLDRSRRIFGSDHHPLLATVRLKTSA
jgi:endonuclease/exonuclease/phosphatase family metal-dependent hydrolase